MVVGQRARTASDFPLEDICGAGGRWDLMARCVQAALFISHGLRRDSEVVLVLLGPPDPPKAVRVSGAEARRLNPDERSTVALLGRALGQRLPLNGLEVTATAGVHASRRGLDEVLDSCTDGPMVLLDEAGQLDMWEVPPSAGQGGLTFVLGDDRGLSDEQLAAVRGQGALEVRLGPVSLHADHCIAIVHNLLDRAADGRA